MRVLIVVAAAFCAVSCVSSYQGVSGKEVAYLSVPKTESNYQFLGGFSGQNVAIGDINSKGCMVNVAKVNSDSLNVDGKLVVPAGREIGLSVSAYQGNSSCGLGLAVKLEENVEYALSFGLGGSRCGIGIAKLDENGEKSPVQSERLSPGFSRLCKK